MKYVQTLIFSILIASLLFFCNYAPVAAQGASLGIGPPVIQIDATPPASINSPITIENNGEEPVELDIRLRAFTSSPNEDGHVKYYPQNDERATLPIFEKIQITENDHPKESVVLAPQERKTLIMHIGVPKDYSKGDYYFSVIFISKQDAKDPTKSSSQTPVGIATNVLLSLGPKGPASGEVAEFSTPFFQQAGPVPFTVKLKNTSDHFLQPKGEILITNMFGQVIGRVNLLPVNILAKTDRFLPDALQSPEATISADITTYLLKEGYTKPVALWPETFLIGPYSAQLTIALSEQGPVFRRTIYFFALPLSVFIALIITILILSYLAYRIRKRLRKVKH